MVKGDMKMKTRRALILAGACLLLVGGCGAEPAALARSPLAGVLSINEFMASNKSTIADENGDYADWVELYNSDTVPAKLGVMYLTDDLSVPMKWTFPDTTIPAHGYLLVWADGEYRESALHTTFKLSSSGEQLGLYATDGEHLLMVDTLTFGPQGTDTSYGRIPDGGGWRVLTVPTPGAENSTGVSDLYGTLFINEFMASNHTTIADEAGDFDDWVELYNAGDSSVSLAGVHLTDNLATPAKWTFPDTAMAGHGYLLVWADDDSAQGPLHACFNLGAATGEQLGLYVTSNGHLLEVDTLTFGHQSPDTSFGRMPDGGDTWQLFAEPTPGRANGSGRAKGLGSGGGGHAPRAKNRTAKAESKK
jgi:hypothetical protein